MGSPRSDQGWTIVLFGKTGNGKSSVGNIILSTLETREFFPIVSGLASKTKTITEISAEDIKVVDIPDFTNLEVGGDDIRHEIRTLSNSLTNTQYAVLVAVRCDVCHAREEYDIYREFKTLWGEDICSHLIVAFTFGDRQDHNKLDKELKTVNPELKSLLSDAGGQYVLFNDMSDTEDKKNQRDKLWEKIKDLPRQRQGRVIRTQPAGGVRTTEQQVDSDNT
ncbi:immune-associated nucleotide-binding protein 5-like [Pomacea canaliculata]|uniref:immune-associated nucleotide-binding protein 5-like n=1 Tax=Pomacea canaliculata TaxID=400727 RepID=UPI000D735AA2|nr:immune-associated nucleotide-binding protein 5-like [Pomacea canaliculata]XP_025083390.1 immune-associated nucleotide-binding protein 5-like [Pomacea canaliculata]XP_025083391.1 immune-associated nucleotide-binding protein 5-like [Pomacea canaliculata]XP_025083392.1 immune-associated nucleotide-binding protein 5-like [Pomacea canaliculata]XP_025083393.1 immune-associated nucleotide-binding protein 5-like [Pomacea canaliculata]